MSESPDKLKPIILSLLPLILTELTRTLGYMTDLRLPEKLLFCQLEGNRSPKPMVAMFDMNVYGSSTHVIAGIASTLTVTTGLEAQIVLELLVIDPG